VTFCETTEISAAIVAAGSAAARLSECAAFRKTAPAFPGVDLPGHFFKHADEQTIVALRAVEQAAERYGIDTRELTGWGLVAAPRYIGRLTGANVLYKFPRGGTTSVSPHIVAQCSLHSVAGAASIALGMHGPNVGIGGGRFAIADGLVAALTLFETACVPGVWLLVSEFDAEPLPDEEGRPLNDPTCHAVALALVPGGSGASQLTLRLGGQANSRGQECPEPTVNEIAACIGGAQRGLAARWAAWLPWGGRVEMRLEALDQSIAREQASTPEQSLKSAA
jgi:hypothetical protein